MRNPLLIALCASALTCSQAVEPVLKSGNPLKAVRHWMYQLQGLEEPALLESLARSPYDLVVVEPTFTIRGEERFNATGMVKKLKASKPDRLVIAYLEVGEAEEFRSYWNKSWIKPKKNKPGTPAFLLAPDPDGWAGDVSIAFWDPQWQAIWLGESGLIRKVMAAGFDGVYLDWVEAYHEPGVVKEARRQQVDPTRAMVDFITAIRSEVRSANPRGVVIAQNAPKLIDEVPDYPKLIDGLGVEDTWFRGDANAGWDNPAGGDISQDGDDDDSTAGRIAQYQKYLRAGVPVFTVDYCLSQENAAQVYGAAKNAGFVPLVTRISLSRLTTTPPPGLK